MSCGRMGSVFAWASLQRPGLKHKSHGSGSRVGTYYWFYTYPISRLDFVGTLLLVEDSTLPCARWNLKVHDSRTARRSRYAMCSSDYEVPGNLIFDHARRIRVVAQNTRTSWDFSPRLRCCLSSPSCSVLCVQRSVSTGFTTWIWMTWR